MFFATTCILPQTSHGFLLTPAPAPPANNINNRTVTTSSSPPSLRGLLQTIVPTLITSYYGTLTGTVTSAGAAQAWSIIPPTQPALSRIQITFTALSMLSAQLYVDDANGKDLFICVSCGTVVPPTFTTTSGGVTIIVQGINGANFVTSQFTLQYLGVPSVKVPETAWNRSLAMTLRQGYGHVSPALLGGYLPGGSKQQWTIQPANIGTNPVWLSLALFSFGTTCVSRLQIYTQVVGGTKLFDGCVTADAPAYWLKSTTGTVWVVLTSPTGVDQKLNFQLTYYTDTSLYNCGSVAAPDVLVDPSMVITDGSATSGMRTAQTCSWLIQPPAPVGATAPNTVSLILDRVSLKTGGRVTVFDNNQPNGTVLWDANVDTYANSYLSYIPPPPLTSSGGALYVVYTSNAFPSPPTFTGFRGTYLTNYAGSVGTGTGKTTLIMSSAIDLKPPGDGARYTKGVNYTWYVQPAYTYGPITFVFSDLDLRYGSDSLTIYDGVSAGGAATVLFQRVGGGPGNVPLPWIVSTQSSATVVLSTSKSGTDVGGNFRLSYFADGPNYHCGFPNNPGVLTAPSMAFTDGSPSSSNIYPGQNCQWLVAPNNNASVVMLVFSRFNLFGGTLSVYAGSVATGRFLYTLGYSNAVPPVLVVPSGTVGLWYRSFTGSAYNLSSNYGPGKGFAASYFTLTPTTAAPGNAGTIALYTAMMASLSMKPIAAVTTAAFASPTAPAPSVTTVFTASKLLTSSNVTWTIASPAAGPLYFAWALLNVPCGSAYVDLRDGLYLTSPLLARYCGTSVFSVDATYATLAQPQVYSWVSTSGPAATLHYVSTTNAAANNFEVSYYSDGPTYHCGFAANPATLTAPSNIVTNGGGAMLPKQSCQWIINPYGYAYPPSTGAATGGVSRTVVLEFLSSAMAGGTVEVFDGTNSTGTLLWRCVGCNVVPRPIVSTSTALFVRFSTTASLAAKGKGFLAVYWTLASAPTSWQQLTNGGGTPGLVLEMPQGLVLNDRLANNTAAWHLPATTSASEVTLMPRYTNALATWNAALTKTVIDGRPTGAAAFESYVDKASRAMCGLATVRGTMQWGQGATPYLEGSSGSGDTRNVVRSAATQYSSAFLTSTIAQKSLYSVQGSTSTAAAPDPSALLTPATTCKYVVDSGSRWSVNINVARFVNTATFPGRLMVYGGIYGTDALLYDSGWTGSVTSSLSLQAPCGLATIIVETNASAPGVAVNYMLDFTYQLNPLEDGTVCNKYISSLIIKPPPPPINPLYFIIPFGAVGVVMLGICSYLAYRHFPTQYFRWYYQGKIAKYAAMATFHPPFTPKMDQFRNRFFMETGECCVCNDNLKVLRLKCHHGLCLEDLKGYLESALGDISQFPVKCPMHYEGCTGHIEAGTAKRVLNANQYDKFLEFSDRAVLGEGMRCIFCSNYVNFPTDSTSSMVSCPYCMKRFCIRCRKAWHVDARCPLDKFDDTLEQWKAATGAQKCPACMKLIEKDDPDTCNHMVHKITDGIPCIHERTDFCYLCGEAVTQDYPHDEVRNPGVNHFPEGVFQKCRVVLAKEREEERERLRKLRRNRIRNAQRARRGRQGAAGADGDGAGTDGAGGPAPREPPPLATEAEWAVSDIDAADVVPGTERSSLVSAPTATTATGTATESGGARPLRRTNRATNLPPASAAAAMEDAPVPGTAATLTADMLRQHNTHVAPLPEGGRLMQAFDQQWNQELYGGQPQFEEEW